MEAFYMTTLYVNNKHNKDLDLVTAINIAKPFDTIKIAEGTYFNDYHPYYFNIKKSLTIIGDRNVRLNACFVVGGDIQLSLENLTISSEDDDHNTIAIFEHARFYAENVKFIHPAKSKWNTIYCQDSTCTLSNSTVSTQNIETSGLMFTNSLVILVNDTINTVYFNNSNCQLKKCLINHSIGVDYNSMLTFDTLTINGNEHCDDSDIYVMNNSSLEGQYLNLTSKTPVIDIAISSFETDYFGSNSENIEWNYDDESTVLANGTAPFNNNGFE